MRCVCEVGWLWSFRVELTSPPRFFNGGLSDDPLCEKVKHCMDQAALASLSASVSAKGAAPLQSWAGGPSQGGQVSQISPNFLENECGPNRPIDVILL